MKFLALLFLIIASVLGKGVRLPRKLAKANNAFTIHLYEQIDNVTDDNMIFGSFPTHSALALLALGATGKTASEIRNATMLSTKTNEQIRDSFKEMFEDFKKIKEMHIRTINKIFLDRQLQLNPDFERTAADYFHTHIEKVNFKAPKETAAKMNEWVQNQTSSKIKNLIGENQLQETSRFVFVSTEYVGAKWKHCFQERNTYKTDFHNSNNKVVKVDMMKLSANLMISSDSKYKFRILMLPYMNKKANFLIFLPDEIDGLPLVEHNGVDMWGRRNFTRKYVEVHLPKFKVESVLNMIDYLRKMGINKLFTGANLNGITSEQIVVSSIAQKTCLVVNEEGTEPPLDDVCEEQTDQEGKDAEVFKVDRPFIFAIMYDDLSLIVGRMNHF